MKTGSTRMIRINEEILKEVSEIVRSELKDPRLSTLISITKVDTTNDLSLCKIYFSVLGNDEQKSSAHRGLDSAGGFIRKLLAERINLRVTPQVKFILDDSLEHGMKMTKLIDDLRP